MKGPAYGGNFGDLLRQRRAQAGLTQEELADRSGLSVRAIANMERGRTARPYRHSVLVLADALSLAGQVREEFARAARLHLDVDPVTAAAEPVVPRQPAVPRQLPGAVWPFVGRTRELAELTRLLNQAQEQPPGMLVISAVGGTAGVGKTAFAVHWAFSAAAGFPDGQLYVNLRGYDPGQPMSAGDALASFLRALGVPGQDIPAELDERATRYRSLLAGRRMLILLDNASTVEQVRPLLPGTASCMTIVTSRDSLAGLVARDGARRLSLFLLPLAEAVDLLRELIGARVDDDPERAVVLAERCCRLPLALRVAAELATARPAVPLADLVAELAGQQRLDLLDAAGDTRTTVRAVFSWSYRELDPGTARAFRLAGLHPGPDLDGYAVAALTGSGGQDAERRLDQLARAHLIQSAEPGRYVMHDLLRDYAGELAVVEDGEDERRAALTRLFDYYLQAAAAAMDTLFPAEQHLRPRVSPSGALVPPLAHPDSARAWVDSQRAALVAVAVYASAHGWPGYIIGLAHCLRRYLEIGGHYGEAVVVATCARQAAAHVGDHAAQAQALLALGTVEWRQGRLNQATAHYEQAATLSREIGDRIGEARALHNLGLADLRQGRYQQAIDYHQRALAVYCEIGDRISEARARHNLALVDLQQGRYQPAADHLQDALAVFRDAGDRIGEAHVLSSLGAVDLRWGHYQQAADHLQLALALNREISNRSGEAYVLSSLGLLSLREGRHQQAADQLAQALSQCREIGDRTVEAESLNGSGEVFLLSGQPALSRTQHASALALARQIGDHYEQARAHDGLALAYRCAGDIDQVRYHWQTALALYTDLGAPQADQIRAQLAADNTGAR